MPNRTLPQIRSHAQKYIIKLCRKYNLRIKSKKFHKKYPNLLKLKTKSSKKINKITQADEYILELFNYYHRENKPFNIEKVHKHKIDEPCILNNQNLKTSELMNIRIFHVHKSHSDFIKKAKRCDNKNPREEYEINSKRINFILSQLSLINGFNTSFMDELLRPTYIYDDIKSDLVKFVKLFFNENSNYKIPDLESGIENNILNITNLINKFEYAMRLLKNMKNKYT